MDFTGIFRGALKKNFRRPWIEIYGFFGCQGHGNRTVAKRRSVRKHDTVAEIRASPRQWAIRPTLDSHIPMALDFFNTPLGCLIQYSCFGYTTIQDKSPPVNCSGDCAIVPYPTFSHRADGDVANEHRHLWYKKAL